METATATPEIKEARRLKAITMASIRTNPAACKTVDSPVLLCSLIGLVYGTRQVKDPKDPSQFFTAITGEFEAVNAQNGEFYKSGTLYLPSSFQAELVEKLAYLTKLLADEGASSTSAIEIGYEIYSVKDGCPAGYTYQMRELKPASVNDPLAALRRDIVAAGASKLVKMAAAAELPAGEAPQQIAAPENVTEIPAASTTVENGKHKRKAS